MDRALEATAALSDRINIQNKHRYPEWSLSAQTLLDCSDEHPNNGCQGTIHALSILRLLPFPLSFHYLFQSAGGNPGVAFEWIRQNGIASESCSPYLALGVDKDQKFSPAIHSLLY